MAASPNPVTLDELVKEVGIPKDSLRKRCTDDHLRKASLFLDWRITAPHLGLEEAEIKAIEREATEEEKRLKTLQKWKAKYGFKATYRRLVQALLSVGRADHAEDVCRLLAGKQDTATLGSSSEESSENSTPPTIATTQESDLPGSLPTRKRNREQEALRYQIPTKKIKLSYRIEELDQQFRGLARRTAVSLIDVDLIQLKVHITQLPVTMQHRHVKFLSRVSLPIMRAENPLQIFEILGRYWNFFNCGLLKHIIDEFGSEELKVDMKEYEKRLKEFRTHTKVGEFIKEWTGDRPPDFSDLTMEMVDEWKDRTLEDLEEFQEKFALQCAIEPYLKPPFVKGRSSSIFLSWGLHHLLTVNDVKLLCKRMATQHFLQRHGVLRIWFKGVCVFDHKSFHRQETRRMLAENAERISRRQLFYQALNFIMIVSSALMIWKGLMVVTNCESPIIVVFGDSMEPAISQGDLLFLTNYHDEPIQAGEILVFKVKDKDMPRVHRVMRVHETSSGDLKILTKADNYNGDDREEGIYSPGQMWVTREDIVGRARGYLPYVGMVTSLMNDYPALEYVLLGGLGVFVLLHRE